MTAMSFASPLSTGSAYARGSELLRRNWGWFVFRGALALLLGVVTILVGLAFLGVVPWFQRDVRFHKVPAVGLAGREPVRW